MQTFTCPDKCCTIKIKPYINVRYPFEKNRKCQKAGVFIYDPITDKVLLVQSRGRLWGPPKGTLHYEETERQCAVREVKEETGLDISADDFTQSTKICNRAIYFYLERGECEVNVQEHIYGNDANGICWIKPSCLKKCIDDGNISLSRHCRTVFSKFKNILFTQTSFTRV